MSWSWFIYAPRPQAELLEIADALHDTIAVFLEANPDCEDEFGEVGAGGAVPSADAVRARRASIDAKIIERLGKCRATLSIDPVPEARLDSALQVSALIWLLETIGPCVVDWGELDLVLSEKALVDLRRKPNRGALDDLEGLDGDEDDDDAPASPARKGGPGAARAETSATKLRAAIDDVERSIDLRRALKATTNAVRTYAAFLLEEGAMDDESAARLLGVPKPEVERSASALAAMLEALEEDE